MRLQLAAGLLILAGCQTVAEKPTTVRSGDAFPTEHPLAALAEGGSNWHGSTFSWDSTFAPFEAYTYPSTTAAIRPRHPEANP